MDEPVRVEVGEALGRAGDPRLADPARNRVLVPAGRLLMGAQKGDHGAPGFDAEAYLQEAPVHEVRVMEFLLGRFPVTVGEYRAFVDAGQGGYLDPRLWDPRGWAIRERKGWVAPDGWREQSDQPNRPIGGVSWYEADAYCRWVGGRLPTEAEWEWAARGPGGRRYSWGDAEATPSHANFRMRVGRDTPVGIYPLRATPEGVRDLAGNVWEWCQDTWHSSYEGAPDDGSAWEDPEGGSRMMRGGSFLNDARRLRATYRIKYFPDDRLDIIGFRVVWSAGGGQA